MIFFVPDMVISFSSLYITVINYLLWGRSVAQIKVQLPEQVKHKCKKKRTLHNLHVAVWTLLCGQMQDVSRNSGRVCIILGQHNSYNYANWSYKTAYQHKHAAQTQINEFGRGGCHPVRVERNKIIYLDFHYSLFWCRCHFKIVLGTMNQPNLRFVSKLGTPKFIPRRPCITHLTR